MGISNVHCNPHSLQGVGPRQIQLGLDTDVSKEANLQQSSSIVPERVNRRQDLAENYFTPSHHSIGNETTDIGLIPKNTRAFMMNLHKTTFEPTSADLDPSIYYAYGPSPNASNLFMRQSCAEYDPLDSGPKRQNSGGGDDQGGGKKRRSENHNNNTPPEKDGANGSGSGSGSNGNGGRGTDEDDNVPNPTGNTPPPTKFACLLYKLDPEKYKRCANCVLTTWGRVLQHLKRVHLLEGDHCPTCRLSFIGEDGEALKNTHTRAGHCQPADITQAGILIEEDYNKLKNIRASSDEKKWSKAWDRMFPHLETPSAFSETHLEFILRNARSSCLRYLERAQGHEDLPSLADGFFADLTRTPTPAARVVGSGAIPTQALQALQAPSSCQVSAPTAMDVNHAWPLNPSGQTTQVPPGLMMLPSALPVMLPPSQQPPLPQPRQVPPDLSVQVGHHSGMSAQESFGPGACRCGQSAQGFPEINPPLPSEPAQSLPNSDLADAIPQQDFPTPETPFAMRESLQGIGASFPALFLDNSYMQGENSMYWGFSTTPQPDSSNQGSGGRS